MLSNTRQCLCSVWLKNKWKECTEKGHFWRSVGRSGCTTLSKMWLRWCNLTYSHMFSWYLAGVVTFPVYQCIRLIMHAVLKRWVLYIIWDCRRMIQWFTVLPWACVHKCCSWSCSAPSFASTRSGWGHGLRAGWCYSGWPWDWLRHRRLQGGGAPCWVTAPSRSPATQGTSRQRWLCMNSERGLRMDGSHMYRRAKAKINTHSHKDAKCSKQREGRKTSVTIWWKLSWEESERYRSRRRECNEYTSGFLWRCFVGINC